MIKNFKHKGLEKFFKTGSTENIEPNHAKRIKKILMYLHAAVRVENMNIPGLRLHQHKGKSKGIWSVDVSGNVRIFFRFVDKHAYDVDYGDPH